MPNSIEGQSGHMKTHEVPVKSLDTDSTVDQSSWDTVGRYVTSLATEPEFIAHTESRNISDKYSMEYASALVAYTEASLAQSEGIIDERTATQVRLAAKAPYMRQASELINHYSDRRKRGERLPEDDWMHYNRLKEQTARYNQMLSGYMYGNTEESFSALSQAISDQVVDHSRDAQAGAYTIGGIVRGARTEAATRHLLEAAGVPFREATIREDLQGADIILKLPNAEYDVDIKKSLDQLAASQGGYDFEESGEMFAIVTKRNGHKKLLFFPGFTDADLGDRVKLSDETTNERKDIVAGQLMRAAVKLGA